MEILYLESIDYLSKLSTISIIFRVLLSMLLGGILGYERGKKRRPAGLRTYLVVCVASSMAMMTGVYLTEQTGYGDASRIAAQVISGIGFLGAGTILVTKHNQVKGLTTAAGLWAAACIGLSLGAGFYTGAIVGFTAIWLSLSIVTIMEKRLYKNSKIINIYVEFEHINSVSRFISEIRKNHGMVRELETTKLKNIDGSYNVSALMTLKFSEKKSHAQIIEEYGNIEGVVFIDEVA